MYPQNLLKNRLFDMTRINRKRRTNSVQLNIAADIGGSGLKAIYGGHDEKLESLFMEPEVISIPKTAIEDLYQDKLGNCQPEDAAWVGCHGKYVAVGYYAASRFYANAGLKELKYERGLYKILACVWAIAQKLQCSKSFKLNLAVLLPVGEYETRKKFEHNLRSLLKSYETPTGVMSVELGKFSSYPEGAGVFLLHSKASEIKHKKIAIAMIGYRNASVLISYRGVLDSGKTSDLGMVRMIDNLMSKTSGFSESKLCRSVVESGHDIHPAPLYKITRTTTTASRNQEVTELVSAIKEAKALYLVSLISWLDNVIPYDVDEIIFCGGTVDYLKKDLNSHYRATPCIWHGGFTIPEVLDSYQLGSRLIDVYGAFLYFMSGLNITKSQRQEIVR